MTDVSTMMIATPYLFHWGLKSSLEHLLGLSSLCFLLLGCFALCKSSDPSCLILCFGVGARSILHVDPERQDSNTFLAYKLGTEKLV